MTEQQVDTLLAEYSNIASLSNHVDNVRNVLTSFFLTLNGGLLVLAGAALGGGVKTNAYGSGEGIVAAATLGLAVIGVLFVMTIARLRRVQLERYGIGNAILDQILGSDGDLRRVVGLHSSSLPGNTQSKFGERRSGSYFWTLIIIVPNSVLIGIFTYSFLFAVHELTGDVAATIWGAVTTFAMLVVQDQLYLRLSRP